MKRNVAGQVVGMDLHNVDGSPFTGNATCYITVDNGTQTVGTGSPAGQCEHKGNGFHTYLPTQAETDGDHIAFTFVAPAGINKTAQVYTTFPQTGDAFARIGAPAGASLSADVAAVKTQTADIEADTADIQSRIPAALIGGRIDANVGAISGDSAAADNLEAAADGTGYNLGGGAVVAASVTGAVGSVTGAVGSVTGNVGGNVVGSVASVTGNVGGNVVGSVASVTAAVTLPSIPNNWITAAGIDADAITAAKVAADVHQELIELAFTYDATATYATADPGSLVAQIADNAGGSSLTPEDIADAVWDEDLSGHVAAGSAGEALGAAGTAGDPWIASLPGGYAAGQAGYILGTNLDAAVSTRATQASLDAMQQDVDALVTVSNAAWTMIEPAAGSPGEFAFTADALRAAIAAMPDPAAYAILYADALLARDIGSGTGEGASNERTVRSALRFVRNRWTTAAGTLTVYKEDDATVAWTATLSTTPGADPVTGNDPA